MDSDVSGWLWFVIDVIMVAALAIALIYASMLWRRGRSRALEQTSERATARLYEREAERERKTEADRARR
jgi:membrane protein implicated in regulation of membrane protease activity